RVVVMRYAIKPAALRSRDRLLEEVSELPAEVPARHRQQHARTSVGIDQRVPEVLPSKMHMRMQAFDMAVLFEGKTRAGFVVGLAGRYRQLMRDSSGGDYSLFNRPVRENQSDAALVMALNAVRRIVDLEYQRRAGL